MLVFYNLMGYSKLFPQPIDTRGGGYIIAML
jgi:hypothetical protein